MDAIISNIEKIDFAGGEVLFQKQFFPVLERLAQHPNAKNLYIFFHSNFNAPFNVVRLNELIMKITTIIEKMIDIK